MKAGEKRKKDAAGSAPAVEGWSAIRHWRGASLADERGLAEREVPPLRLLHERGRGRLPGEAGLPALLRILT